MNLKSIISSPLGFGTAPLGNMYRAVNDTEAVRTVEEAWNKGVRYFDTAPFYGAGLAESRLGDVLSNKPRDQYVISTKVGRVILDEEEDPATRELGEKSGLFEFGRPNKILNDYSAEGTMRAIEGSLKRLKTDRIDIVWVHDIAQDFYGDEWLSQFETARKGAFRVLTRLREEGVIRAWGLGVNRVEPCELALDLEDSSPDGFLLAGRYSLLDHSRALQRLMPEAIKQNVGIVVGGPYNSGVIAGGEHYEYQTASPAILEKVKRFKSIAQRFDINLKAAALNFSLAHPAVTAVIPGATRPERISEDLAAVNTIIPTEFWESLREEGLLDINAPVPDEYKA